MSPGYLVSDGIVPPDNTLKVLLRCFKREKHTEHPDVIGTLMSKTIICAMKAVASGTIPFGGHNTVPILGKNKLLSDYF